MDVEGNKTFLFLGLLTLIHFTHSVPLAAPAPPKQKPVYCARQCNVPKQLKFHFARNSVYEYSYTTDTAIFFLNTPDAASRLTITGTAHIYVSTPCDFVLKLYDVVTLESDPVDQGHMRKSNRSRDFGVDLEREPLRFSFQDGRIHDICPVENENTWALNIKRGFLSAFQNSMKNLSFDENVQETDIFGQCSTYYKVMEREGQNTSVVKVRNISNCSQSFQKHSTNAGIGASVDDFKPKSISPWTSIQECKQTIDSVGRLYSITCRGEHHFRPMRGEPHGAATVTSQEILFLRQSTRLETHPPFSKRLSLQYDSVEQDRQDKNSVMEKIGQILQNLCEHSKNGFRQDTPHVFWDLVACMRRLDAPLLKSLYETASSSSRCSDKTYIKIFHLLQVLNSSVNIIFYAAFSTRFRQLFVRRVQHVSSLKRSFSTSSASYPSKRTVETADL